MSKCPADLWRAVHSDDFPKGPIVNDEPVKGILYPAFMPKQIGFQADGTPKYRDPDVAFDEKGLVKPGGGTSLFDKENVFRGKNWQYFYIPKDTVIDPNLVITGPEYRKAFSANHYQVEPATPMFPEVLKGALDNFARAAVAKAYEDAHG
ncbi:hypothetical protein ACFONN_17830 [Dyella humi]|uniref:Tse2 ADP-ribosyltransferase toxin domain-containing protein n=1 Tax=Dyella humi TaxID=1770547 RepID=A0ABW8IDK2_9GAMM